jgi:putative cardiolipin synthase
VQVVADTPDKFAAGGRPRVAEALGELAGQAREEILIETAYFVPTNRTFERVEERLDAGIKVRALTNSLASNDVLAAHAGYARHRKALLRSGVEVHELKLHPGAAGQQPGRQLHTKAVVFDRRKFFVGTFNLDPRSAELNTEIGLLVDSPALAREICAFIEQGMHPQQSWQVVLCSPATSQLRCRQGQLVWLSDHPAGPPRQLRDPQSSPVARTLATVLSWLPLDPLL